MSMPSRFPAEWEPLSGVILAWPHAGTDWAPRLAEVEQAYVGLVSAVARFEPGESKEVTLVEIGGSGEITGLNNLTEGSIHDPNVRKTALAKARANGYLGAE